MPARHRVSVECLGIDAHVVEPILIRTNRAPRALLRVIQEHDGLSIIPAGIVEVGQERRHLPRIFLMLIEHSREGADLGGARPLEVLMHPEPELDPCNPENAVTPPLIFKRDTHDFGSVVQVLHPGDRVRPQYDLLKSHQPLVFIAHSIPWNTLGAGGVNVW